MQVNMHEAKSQLSALAERVLNGEEIVIAKSGKPILDLVAHNPSRGKRRPGRFMEFRGQYIYLDEPFEKRP